MCVRHATNLPITGTGYFSNWSKFGILPIDLADEDVSELANLKNVAVFIIKYSHLDFMSKELLGRWKYDEFAQEAAKRLFSYVDAAGSGKNNRRRAAAALVYINLRSDWIRRGMKSSRILGGFNFEEFLNSENNFNFEMKSNLGLDVERNVVIIKLEKWLEGGFHAEDPRSFFVYSRRRVVDATRDQSLIAFIRRRNLVNRLQSEDDEEHNTTIRKQIRMMKRSDYEERVLLEGEGKSWKISDRTLTNLPRCFTKHAARTVLPLPPSVRRGDPV